MDISKDLETFLEFAVLNLYWYIPVSEAIKKNEQSKMGGN